MANYLDAIFAVALVVQLAVIICDIVRLVDDKLLVSHSLGPFVKLRELPADVTGKMAVIFHLGQN